MSELQLEAFFRNVAQSYESRPEPMDFVWHGGEPLLLGTAFYETVFELQHKYLDRLGIPWENSIQTNLNRLGAHELDLLRHFANVGVSIDLFGDLRVDAQGRGSQQKVLEHMQELIDADINFGCITVLSQRNVSRLHEIFHFFNDLRVSFRLLPIYRTGFPHQQDNFGLNLEELLRAMLVAVDLWFDLEAQIEVKPIQDYVLNVVKQYSARIHQMGAYSKKPRESLFIVNTDGHLYSNADAYANGYSYGCIFDDPLDQLLNSAGYKRSVAERMSRVKAVCNQCARFGSCSGFYVAEATPEQRFIDVNGHLCCGIVEPLTAAIEKRMIDEGIVDPIRGQIDPSWVPNLNQSVSEACEF